MGSVSFWITALKQGQPEAAVQLWQRYARQVMHVARAKLPRSHFSLDDEEDITIAVFDVLFRGTSENQFPDLHDRSDLWGLLIHLTELRVVDTARRQLRQKRGGHRVRRSLLTPGSADGINGVPADAIHDPHPTPDMTAALADECRFLVDCLDDELLQTIALLRLNGHDVESISSKLNRPLRTIERKLQLIRKIWQSRRSDTSE